MPDGSALVRTHAPAVWQTIHRLLGASVSDADAADCFQEVFVSAIQFAKKQKVLNWEALLRRIATSKALDSLRHRIRSRKRIHTFTTEMEFIADPSPPAANLEHEELASQLRIALLALKPVAAEAFCLRHLENMPYDLIADQLNMTPTAVGVLIHRTKQTLQQLMTQTQTKDPLSQRGAP